MTNPVFVSVEQLDAAHKLAKHFGLWWTISLSADEIANLVGMTADEIKTLCDRAVERDIAIGCDDSAWRVDPRPDYRTGAGGNGRTRWVVGPDGSVRVYIHRPTGVVLSARWKWRKPLQVSCSPSATHLRHVAALIEALRALDPSAEAKVWKAISREKHPAVFSRLVEEETEWRSAGLPDRALFQWRSSREAAL